MKKSVLFLLFIIVGSIVASAYLPSAGYRGFLEGHFDVGSERNWWGNREAYYYYGASTTHGRQFNPHLFVGGGLDVEYNPSFDRAIIAVYAAGRTDWQFGRFTPYGDLRIGLNLTDGAGVYFSPTVGYRFNWGGCVAINVGVGLTLKSKRVECYDLTIRPDGMGVLSPLGRQHVAECLFALRLAVEFNTIRSRGGE